MIGNFFEGHGLRVRTDYANEILKAIPQGALLTTKAGDKVNTMTIGWGTLGTTWYKPVFVAYIREHRFTMEQLAKNAEFTVNIPLAILTRKFSAIVAVNMATRQTR